MALAVRLSAVGVFRFPGSMPMPSDVSNKKYGSGRQAAVAAIVREGKLLVIKRALTVRAPGKLCFPGGHIERGEHAAEAIVRELDEELGVEAVAIGPLWISSAPSGCQLHWLECKLADPESPPKPNPSEVHSVQWMSVEQLAEHPDVLVSNFSFLEHVKSGRIRFRGEQPVCRAT
jgi:8-oxo-dGTP pyrophosphatase MutT (NUDIX family)